MSSIQDEEDEFAEETHPTKSLVQMVIDVDDLTQLSNIHKQQEHRLKRIGYDTLYETRAPLFKSLLRMRMSPMT
jgi:hypothetical protein